MSETISDTQLILKDWEMTKDRIKHFDDVVIRIRIGGIPIALAIQAGAWAVFDHIKNIRIPFLYWNPTAISIIFAFGLLYVLAIGLLDLVHFQLLRKAVKHGKEI